MSEGMKDLIGKTVKAIRINDVKDLIELTCDDGILYLSAVGDCCSTSWFEHMTGVEALIGHTIKNVLVREMPPPKTDDEDDEFDVTDFYGWTLETEAGRCDIEMRNQSNGYYGGTCEVSSKALDQYGREREDKDSTTKAVTDDF